MDKAIIVGCGIAGGLVAPIIAKAAKAAHQSQYGPLVECLTGIGAGMVLFGAVTPPIEPMT